MGDFDRINRIYRIGIVSRGDAEARRIGGLALSHAEMRRRGGYSGVETSHGE